MKERKLYLRDKLTVNRSEKQVIIYSVLVTVSQTSVHIIKIFSVKKIEDRSARFKYFLQARYHVTYCTI